MDLKSEAAYLYYYSKKLKWLNRKIRRLSKKATKHKEKHDGAKKEGDKLHHKTKHAYVSRDIKELMKKHNKIINKIKYHYHRFMHSLSHQHKF